jgi:hypothetical protein
MEEPPGYSEIYNYPYPAVDAIVVAALNDYIKDAPIPLEVHWRATSAGSSLHQITDVGKNEVLRATVWLLPDNERAVTVVDLETKHSQTARTFPTLIIAIHQLIARHRANLRLLQQHGVGLPLTEGVPSPPPPPQPGDKEGQIAILDWYARYNPKAINKEIRRVLPCYRANDQELALRTWAIKATKKRSTLKYLWSTKTYLYSALQCNMLYTASTKECSDENHHHQCPCVATGAPVAGAPGPARRAHPR